MICRKCREQSPPIPFGYCRRCAKEMGAVFQDEKPIDPPLPSGNFKTLVCVLLLALIGCAVYATRPMQVGLKWSEYENFTNMMDNKKYLKDCIYTEVNVNGDFRYDCAYREIIDE